MAAKRSYPTSKVRGSGWEYQTDGAGTAEKSYPASKVRGGGWEELPHAPKPEARGGSQEEQPHEQPRGRGGGLEDQPYVQGALAARVQEGLEELIHIEGQEGWRWGDTPLPR